MTDKRRPPWYLFVPAAACGVGVLVPISYLLVRALDADADQIGQILLRWRNVRLLLNTLGLTAGVLVTTSVLALPIAWLTSRADLPLRRVFTLAMVLPLAVPGYLMAYTLLAIGGDYGALARLTAAVGQPWSVPRLQGYVGALVALSLYNLPYMVLNLRAALNDLDPAVEEMAQALGQRPVRMFFGVVVPHLRPALLAGSLLVALHVITDFGVVSLMGYHTFSYALYLQFDVANGTAAAWIALMMLVLAGLVIGVELWMLRGLRLHRAGMLAGRTRRSIQIGWWKGPAIAFLGTILFASVLLPAATITYWATEANVARLASDLIASVNDSLLAALPAAVLATLMAAPVAYVARRYPTKRSVLAERISYLGYATPSLAFALGLLVFTLHIVPVLYQSLAVLVYAYALHFVAEAVGPIRANLYQTTPRLEEASRSLGRGAVSTFFCVTLPLLRQGLLVSLALVFLSTMKELPLTFLLAPLGFQTLATNIWGFANEAMYADAAPFALAILLLSSLFVGVLLLSERKS